LELDSSDEDENSSQQVIFVTYPKDFNRLFGMAKSKKLPGDTKRKPNLLKASSVKNQRHIFDKSFSKRTYVQELFALFKTKKKKIATWNATICCARKLGYPYLLVQANHGVFSPIYHSWGLTLKFAKVICKITMFSTHIRY
jgi:hypothetical protein